MKEGDRVKLNKKPDLGVGFVEKIYYSKKSSKPYQASVKFSSGLELMFVSDLEVVSGE